MIKRKKIEIRKPFYSAGSPKMYNWGKDGFGDWGIGIDINLINNYDSLDIILNKEHYRVSTKTILDFIKKYNSLYKVRNYNKVLGVFSISIMRNITTQQ